MRTSKLAVVVVLTILAASMLGATGAREPRADAESANVVLAHVQGEWSWSGLEALAAAYAERSGNTLELLYVPAEQMSQWSQAQFIGGTEPDLIWSAGQPAPDYFRNGWIVDLRPHYESVSPYTGERWADSFRPGLLQGVVDPTLGDAMLGMPVAVVTVNLFYNRDIFAEIGLPDEAPTSWSQVLEYAKRVDAAGKGYVPYSIQNSLFWNLSWQEFNMMEQLWHDVVDDLDVINPNGRLDIPEQALGVVTGVIDPTDQRMVDYYAFLKEFAQYFNRGFNAASWEYERLFNEGEAAMNLNGSWFPNQVRMNEIDLNYGTGPMPYVDTGVSPYAENRLRRYSLGLGGTDIVVTRSAEKTGVDHVVDFLQFWTDPESGASMFVESFMFLPVVKDVPVPDELEGIVQYLGTDEQRVNWNVHSFTPEQASQYHTMLQTYLTDDTSPAAFAAKVADLTLRAANEVIKDHPEWRIDEHKEKVSR